MAVLCTCAEHCSLQSFCVVLSLAAGYFTVVMCHWHSSTTSAHPCSSLCVKISPLVLCPANPSILILCRLSTPCQLMNLVRIFFGLPYHVQQTQNFLKGINWTNCRDRLFCFPSTRDHYFVLPDFQCLAKHHFIILFNFVVVLGGTVSPDPINTSLSVFLFLLLFSWSAIIFRGTNT